MDKKTLLLLAALGLGGYLFFRARKKASEKSPTTQPDETQQGKVRNTTISGGVPTDIGGGVIVNTGGVRPIPGIANSATVGKTFDEEQQETAFSPLTTQMSPPDIGFETQPRVLNPQLSSSSFGTRLSAPAEAMFVGYQVPQFGMQRIDVNF